MLTIAELSNLSLQELKNELTKSERKLFKYSLGLKTKQNKDTHNFHICKKNVATIKTILSSKKSENPIETKEEKK